MASIRERLAALAEPLEITLPEEYIAFVENPPERGILIRHLCNASDPASEWWPAGIDVLEADIHDGKWDRVELNAHYMRTTAEPFLEGGHESVPESTGNPDRLREGVAESTGNPDRLREGVAESTGEPFATARLSRGFWIGEVDGDSVFLDHETLGVFAWLQHEDEVEQWATSFADFVARGQRTGRFAKPDPVDGGA